MLQIEKEIQLPQSTALSMLPLPIPEGECFDIPALPVHRDGDALAYISSELENCRIAIDYAVKVVAVLLGKLATIFASLSAEIIIYYQLFQISLFKSLCKTLDESKVDFRSGKIRPGETPK